MTGAAANWIRATWDSARTSLWLVPGLMFLLGIVLALLLLPLEDGFWSGWISAGSGDDARNLLSTLLTSVIAMASIVFSVTVVSLSVAATAYGSRLIRTFRSARSTQFVLGTFMMTIVYLLLVLREIRGEWSPAEVPEAAVAVGTALALLSVLALLAFIQSVARLMVADEVIRRVRLELDSAIAELPPKGSSPSAEPAELPQDFGDNAGRIRLPREGYVQSVDYGGMIQWAEKHGCILRLDFRPGDFVVEGDHKLLVYPEPADVEKARRELAKFIVSGERRTPTQDLEFAIRHLVEIAVRALSPGINDPFTALAVIDRLRGGLARLAGRELPHEILPDRSGRLRMARKTTTFGGAVEAAFDQIRQAGSSKPAVLIHMLRAIGAIAEHTRDGAQREALLNQVNEIRDAGKRDVADPSDHADLEHAYDETVSALKAAEDPARQVTRR